MRIITIGKAHTSCCSQVIQLLHQALLRLVIPVLCVNCTRLPDSHTLCQQSPLLDKEQPTDYLPVDVVAEIDQEKLLFDSSITKAYRIPISKAPVELESQVYFFDLCDMSKQVICPETAYLEKAVAATWHLELFLPAHLSVGSYLLVDSSLPLDGRIPALRLVDCQGTELVIKIGSSCHNGPDDETGTPYPSSIWFDEQFLEPIPLLQNPPVINRRHNEDGIDS